MYSLSKNCKMKLIVKLFTLLFLLPAISHSQLVTSPSEKSHSQIELNTKSFIENYLAAVSGPDWETKMVPFLRNPKGVERFREFKKAFENLRYDIKHLAVSGNEGLVWITVSGVNVAEFNDFDFKNIPATHQEVKWDEVWFYTVDENGKFGEKFELFHNNHQRMRALNIKCLPD